MRDPIKTKENNQRGHYTYVKSRESATTVVNTETIVDNLWRLNRTSTVCTAKRMDDQLNNVTARRSMVKNAHTVTIRVTNKRSTGRNKSMTKKKKSKRLMSLKRYIMTSSSLEMMHVHDKLNNQQVNLANVRC